jgi:hypothetical protein
MKKFIWCIGFILSLFCGSPAFCQDTTPGTNSAGGTSPGAGGSATNTPVSFPDGTKVLEITPHTTTYFVPDGTTNRFGAALGRKILATCTGGSYWTGTGWAQSDPTFEVTAQRDAFVADRVNHRARISTDLNATNAITITMPNGTVIASTPVAIGLLSAKDGRSVIIASITDNTNAFGALTAPNEITFRDAFLTADGNLRASVVLRIEAGTFSQDCVIHKLDISAFGFSEADQPRIQIYTELYQFPEPELVRHPLKIESDEAARAQMAVPDLYDTTVGLGEFVLGNGRAYVLTDNATNSDSSAAAVGKEIVSLNSRNFLVETLEYSNVRNALQALNGSVPDKIKRTASLGPVPGRAKPSSGPSPTARAVPPPINSGRKMAASSAQRAMELAALQPRVRSGLWIDYLSTIGGTISSSTTWTADQTIYCAGATYVNGALTCEGGLCVKYPASNGSYSTNAFVQVNSTLTLKSGPYRPIVFTAADDTSCGDSISTSVWAGYTGSTSGKYYANPALLLQSSLELANCRFSFAKLAISYASPTEDFLTVSDSQFFSCMEGIRVTATTSGLSSGTTVTANNDLFAGVGSPFSYYSTPSPALYMNQCTIDAANPCVSVPNSDGTVSAQATNCIFANIADFGSSATFVGANNGFYSATAFGDNQFSSSSSPFQTVGGGAYYLADGSPFRGAATTNLNSILLSALKTKTTWPPILGRGDTTAFIANDLTLDPQVYRDRDVKDLGVHYPPIDWALSFTYVSNATVTISPGTVITFYKGSSFGGVGANYGGNIVSQGRPDNLVRLVQAATVQEQCNRDWAKNISAFVIAPFSGTGPDVLNFRFTDFSCIAQDNYFLSYGAAAGYTINLQDCQFHGGRIDLEWHNGNFTNCLFERVDTTLASDDTNPYYIRNNLFFGGGFTFYPSSTTSIVQDNLFDKTTIDDDLSGGYVGGYNAFITNCDRLIPTNTHDLLITGTDYKPGFLSQYYYPQTGGKLSTLLNAGSTTANAVQLFQYTLITNTVSGLQIAETNSVVDIGWHVAATDSTGRLQDHDADGIPSVLEDANGNGAADTGETDWQNSENGTTSVAGLVVFTFLE